MCNGTKMICLGNVEQIDTPYLTEATSGLTYAVDRFRNWEYNAICDVAPRRTLASSRLRLGSAVSAPAKA